jgi:polyhydroxybutyrate depolymerase
MSALSLNSNVGTTATGLVWIGAVVLAACASDGKTPSNPEGSSGTPGVGSAGRASAGQTGLAGAPLSSGGASPAGGVAGATGVSGSGSAGTPSSSGGGGMAAGNGGRPAASGAGTGGAGGMNAAGLAGSAMSAGTSGDSAGSSAAGGAPPATCPDSATVKPGETTKTAMVGGTQRSFLVHIPTGYDGKTPMPVVIDFHPLGGTGSSQKGLSGWGALGDEKGFIVVWPDGVGGSWNVGRCCSTAQEQNVDDVAFTRAIIASLEADACIDSKRIYASGCSNGGGMAFKVACDAADVIAAVAPVDFDCVTNSGAEPSCGMCTPARPISEIQFRGTSDTAVPYDGGSGPRGTVFPGAAENFSEWGEINACTGEPAAVPEHTGCQAYGTCGAGVSTTLCTVQNGTHCGNYGSFHIIDIAWDAFQKAALP